MVSHLRRSRDFMDDTQWDIIFKPRRIFYTCGIYSYNVETIRTANMTWDFSEILNLKLNF